MTRGRDVVGCSPPSALPKSATISSRTILTTSCDGPSPPRSTSLLEIASIARSRTRSTNALTTLKLTSASRSASRISRSAASMFSGVSFASPRSVLKTSCRRVLSESNMSLSCSSAKPYRSTVLLGRELATQFLQAAGGVLNRRDKGARRAGLVVNLLHRLVEHVQRGLEIGDREVFGRLAFERFDQVEAAPEDLG